MVENYSKYTGLDLAEAREDINLQVTEDEGTTVARHLDIKRKMLIRKDTQEPLGLISKKRGILEYGKIMDWITNELTDSGVDFKLRDSMLTKRGDFYQEYLFSEEFKGPDGSVMTPMLLVRGSYTGMPLRMDWGTYRFVCSNGVVVGNTIQSIKVRPSQLENLLESSIVGDIRVRMEAFKNVLTKYKTLEEQSYDPFIKMLLIKDFIPMMMKKLVMYQLRDSGDVQLPVEKLKGEHISAGGEALYSILKEQTAWYLYNVMTSIATNETRTVNGRISNYASISKLFEI